MKKLTIIVLGNKGVNETIKSLQKQVYKDIEIIVSKENIKKVEKEEKCVFISNEELYSDEENKKLNIKLLKKLESDYFTIINSGDSVGVDMYRQAVEYLDKKNVETVMVNTVYEVNGEKVTYNLLESSIPENLNTKLINDIFEKESKLTSVFKLHGNKIYKKEVVSNVKLDDENLELEENILKSIKTMKKIDCDALIHILSKDEIKENEKNNFYSVVTKWDYGVEAIKEHIIDDKIKYVSFDVFDTLILRPFLEPRDEMILLNPIINKYYKNGLGIDFYNIRFESELYARDLVKDNEKVQDVTLDEIYDAMAKMYKLDKNIIEELKENEIKNELKYCMQRKTSYEFYKLAKYVGKKVIVISDMYLSKNNIKAMVEKCGYTEIDKYYISSEIKLTKASGDLYQYVMDELDIKPEQMMHIGDNWFSDWKQSGSYGIVAEFLPRTINMLYESNFGKLFFSSLPFYDDNVASTNFLTIRCLLALIANKFYDNPWKKNSFDSVYNANIKFFGYSALGMHLYGITRWILDDMTNSKEKYDTIQFMARDGYLPIQSYELMSKLYPKEYVAKPEYLYISRKALMPIIFYGKEDKDMYKLIGSVNVFNHSPRQILKYLKSLLKYTEEDIQRICDELLINSEESFKQIYTFNLFLNKVRSELLDEEYSEKYIKSLEKYFCEKFKGNACAFDIGYSARPELILSKICKKPIDVYYINTNEQSAYENAKIGGFKIKSFLDYKPVVTGSIREILISKMGPSCIGYDCKDEEVKPIFEKYNENIDYENVINIIQNSALELVEDVVNIFGKSLNEYEYYKQYTNIPLDMFINCAEQKDKEMLKVIVFEDDVGMGKDISILKILENERKKYNQFSFNKLYNITDGSATNYEEIGRVDLTTKSKFSKALYYILFRRDVFKRRMREIFNKFKIIKK